MTTTITGRKRTVRELVGCFECSPAVTVQEDECNIGRAPMSTPRDSDNRTPPKPTKLNADDDGAKRLLLDKLRAAFDGPGDFRAALARLRKILGEFDGGATAAPTAFESNAERVSYLRGMTTLESEQERQARIQRLRS